MLPLVVGNYSLENALPHIFPGRSQKSFDYFREHKDEYDVVFVGSSLFYRQIIPKEFDFRLRKEGYEVKSFNFGIPGMYFHEANVVIEHLLALKPKRLKWLFIDSGNGENLLGRRNWYTNRAVQYHTPNETWSIIADIMEYDEPFTVRTQAAFEHATQMLMYSFHVGRGPKIVRQFLLDNGIFGKKREARVRNQGFLSADDSHRDGGKRPNRRRLNFLKQQNGFSQLVKEAQEEIKRGLQLKESYQRRFVNQAAKIRQAGIEPIYVVGPIASYRQISLLAAENDLITLFAYNDPAQYLTLYQPNLRFDHVHVNRNGARILTRLVARDFAAFLEDKE